MAEDASTTRAANSVAGSSANGELPNGAASYDQRTLTESGMPVVLVGQTSLAGLLNSFAWSLLGLPRPSGRGAGRGVQPHASGRRSAVPFCWPTFTQCR